MTAVNVKANGLMRATERACALVVVDGMYPLQYSLHIGARQSG